MNDTGIREAAGVVGEAEVLVQQAGYCALWDHVAAGDLVECQYGCSLSTFRVRQRIPEGLIADMVTSPGCQGIVLDTSYHRGRYCRRVFPDVARRVGWWARLRRLVVAWAKGRNR